MMTKCRPRTPSVNGLIAYILLNIQRLSNTEAPGLYLAPLFLPRITHHLPEVKNAFPGECGKTNVRCQGETFLSRDGLQRGVCEKHEGTPVEGMRRPNELVVLQRQAMVRRVDYRLRRLDTERGKRDCRSQFERVYRGLEVIHAHGKVLIAIDITCFMRRLYE